jgi:multidrug efflux system membrane fusion protein
MNVDLVSVPPTGSAPRPAAFRRLGAAGGMVIAIALAACAGQQPAAPAGGGGMPPAPPVGVASPIARTVPETREFTGQVEAIATVDIKPQVSGLVKRVLVADGAEVAAGAPILEIDDAPLFADLNHAQAAVTRAQAVLAQARLQLSRTASLMADHVMSQQQYDDQAATVDIARADLASAQAALATSKLNLEWSHVSAPMAGHLGKIQTAAGNLVQGGGPVPATVIATLVSVDPVYVSFDLDETTWRRMGERLRAAAAGTGAVPVAIALDGEDGYPHAGTVAWIDNQVDTRSGTIRIRAKVANGDRALTPGAFARVQLEVATPRPVLLVNERAVMSQLATRYVYTVGDHGVTQFRPVQLGTAIGPLRIVEGLGPQDVVVVSNLSHVFFPGMPVDPKPASMETLQMLDQAGGGGAPPAAAPGKPAPATGAAGKQ